MLSSLTRTTGGLFRLALLLLPAALVFLASLRAPQAARPFVGPSVFILVITGALLQARAIDPFSVPAVLLYVIALCWVLVATNGVDDPLVYSARAVLLVTLVVLFGRYCLRQSGALLNREAQRLADRIARRAYLPADHTSSRLLPEVEAFRAALALDANPALSLLSSPRNEVRLAALCALEGRPSWQPGQAGFVLSLAQQTHDPETRAAAVLALGGCTNRSIVEPLADFLADAALVVRRAAAEAVLWETDERWPWIRHPFRLALGGADGQGDGPLLAEGCPLSAETVEDLTGWSAEKGVLAARAAATLGAHFALLCDRAPDAELLGSLRRQVGDPHVPAGLRLELARLLYAHGELDDQVMRLLIDPSAPAPLRLIGVEALLQAGNSAEALGALHELGRLPNREIALTVADVAQRQLGLDFGLKVGEPPPLHSRHAAEVARRVQRWASESNAEPAAQEHAASPQEDTGW
jgi:hypothetical protein